MAEFLISKVCNIEARTSDGGTPFFLASSNGHCDIIELIISKGCNLEQTNNDGATALHASCGHSIFSASKLLISQGANLEARGDRWGNPLFVASLGGAL